MEENEVYEASSSPAGSDAESENGGVRHNVEPVTDAAEQGGGETPASDTEADAGSKIAALEVKVAELNDQYLRKAADFENFRKRTTKEKQEAIDFANQNLLLDIIPVLDDFERALKAAEGSEKNAEGFKNLYDGLKMIEQRLSSNLENKWGLRRFDSKGAVFDPLRHEALMMEKSADVKEALVEDDFMKGYTLKERVIRTAKVKVVMPET